MSPRASRAKPPPHRSGHSGRWLSRRCRRRRALLEVVGEIYDEDDEEESERDAEGVMLNPADGSYDVRATASIEDVIEALGIPPSGPAGVAPESCAPTHALRRERDRRETVTPTRPPVARPLLRHEPPPSTATKTVSSPAATERGTLA